MILLATASLLGSLASLGCAAQVSGDPAFEIEPTEQTEDALRLSAYAKKFVGTFTALDATKSGQFPELTLRADGTFVGTRIELCAGGFPNPDYACPREATGTWSVTAPSRPGWSRLTLTVEDRATTIDVKLTPDGKSFIAVHDGTKMTYERIPTVAIKSAAAVTRAASDPFTFVSAPSVANGTLAVTVSYSGGCQAHTFDLWASNAFMESFPVQVNAALVHEAFDDACEALITTDLKFDLTPLRESYKRAYRTDHGTIVIRLRGTESVSYTF